MERSLNIAGRLVQFRKSRNRHNKVIVCGSFFVIQVYPIRSCFLIQDFEVHIVNLNPMYYK